MKVRFLKPAQHEVDDAVAWYDSQSRDLGTRFLDDLDRTIRRIITFPLSCAEIEPDIRRCLLTRFPYGVIYGIDSDAIVVIAVAHLHREPQYWIDRLLNQGTK
ncbi:MAG: plasmid stabilization protein [Nitrospirae bacterium GWF2_44_13]|nr:MAG: plasmid stabilization protein [Nitrospirae bacterium GWF2_44_13]OGW34802.1 MAG: plasmid stabilization protein [Nitrospirae bacterium GWD2_44_7]OGW63292.1 MAG: plasmid stabilization protein [Nitrospirae bacterium RIFOXYA2_FULL_44_9]OGW70547.1 MAG: plasmid stabilization protein [Nitrospirae bacterium RIFOXYC2_FULL_44_7]HBG92171.1 plasmid stabilization protein [Nitrospiraceae bacterium]